MARKPSALAGIFDDEPEMPSLPIETAAIESQLEANAKQSVTRKPRQSGVAPVPARRSSHPGKKPVLIHIPEDMHRALRQLSVEEGGEPLTVITERLLRQYLVKRGHTRFAP